MAGEQVECKRCFGDGFTECRCERPLGVAQKSGMDLAVEAIIRYIKATGICDYAWTRAGGLGPCAFCKFWAAIKTPGRIAFIVLVVTKAEFEQMRHEWGEYSSTVPTGNFIGKRWLRRGSTMGHYVVDKNPGYIGIEWTPIVVEG